MRSGITRRWLCGSLLMTVLLVLMVEGMFLYLSLIHISEPTRH